MLTPEQIKDYEERLEEGRVRLIEKMEALERPHDFGSDVDDASQEQQEAEELANDLAAGQGLRERVNEIDAALNRIRAGKYGLCEACGGGVSERELELVPETRLCETCKQNASGRE